MGLRHSSAALGWRHVIAIAASTFSVGRIAMKARLNRPHLALAIDGPENVERQEDVATPVLKKSNSFDERRTSFVRVARKVSQQKQIALSSLPAQGSLAEQIAVRIIEQRYKSHLSVVPRDFTLAGGDEPALKMAGAA